MKTLSQHNSDQAEALESWRARRDREDNEKLAVILAAAQTFAVHTGIRDKARQAIAEHRVEWVNIACDKCLTEMVAYEGWNLSNPPSRWCRCPGCGHSGLLR